MTDSSRRTFIRSAAVASVTGAIIPAVSMAMDGNANDDVTNVKEKP